MKIFILILLLNTWYCYCQKDICKTENKADSCMQKLLLLGDPKFVFPEDKNVMNKHCRVHGDNLRKKYKTIVSYEKCIKDYATKCLPAFPRQVTNVLAYGVAKTNKGYCSNNKRKESFISIGKCANKMKHKGDQCMKVYIDNLLGINNYDENRMKIPLACCNYYKLKDCIMKEVESEPELCGQSQYNEIERIIDGYAFDVLQLLCGDYTDDSDKCEKLIGKTPKRKSSQKRSKSLLPPFIAILSSDGVQEPQF